jgi:hypothetical protein
MDYIFGNNEFKKCLMVGYNDLSSSHPHHRASSSPAYGNSVENETKDGGQLDQSHILYGALCGGPIDNAGTYKDTATDYIANEVTIDYNAAFVGALAGLYLKYGQSDQPIDESTLEEVRIIDGGGGGNPGTEPTDPPTTTETTAETTETTTTERTTEETTERTTETTERTTETTETTTTTDRTDSGHTLPGYDAGDPSQATLVGDVNTNGKITISDMIALLKGLNNLGSFDDVQKANANCYQDSRIDVIDVLCLVNYLIGKEESLPVQP